MLIFSPSQLSGLKLGLGPQAGHKYLQSYRATESHTSTEAQVKGLLRLCGAHRLRNVEEQDDVTLALGQTLVEEVLGVGPRCHLAVFLCDLQGWASSVSVPMTIARKIAHHAETFAFATSPGYFDGLLAGCAILLSLLSLLSGPYNTRI